MLDAELSRECRRLYEIDAKTNPRAAHWYMRALNGGTEGMLAYLGIFGNSFDPDYDPSDPITLAAQERVKLETFADLWLDAVKEMKEQ